MDLLFDKAQLRKRIDAVYRRMKQRAQPKYWKSGKRRGQVRVPGLDRLPFTSQELWDWTLQWIGPGAIRCPYCEEIGRSAFLITLENCTYDHKVPLARGGTWNLSNLIPVCASCNREKGSLSYEYFIYLMRDLEKMADLQDRAYMLKCLRTHGVALQMQRGKPKLLANPLPTHPEPALFAPDIQDDF